MTIHHQQRSLSNFTNERKSLIDSFGCEWINLSGFASEKETLLGIIVGLVFFFWGKIIPYFNA